ncbi:MAG TPA: hypothetical protein VF622_17010 [Segetibacter sp.]|jgi:hypothetical protein
MKKNLLLVCVIASLAFASEKINAQYIDLSTGRSITLIKHSGNGIMYNTENSRPVYLYINTATNDTFYGRTGEKVNGKLTRTKEGRYAYDNDLYVYKNGDYQFRTEADNYNKKVFDRDGDVILKGDNGKKKTEIDGDVKRKEGEAKTKIEGDGVLKDKDGPYKMKVDGAGNILEKDSTYKTKLNADGSLKLKDKEAAYKGKVDEKGDVKEKTPAEKRKLKRDEKVKVKTENEKAKVKDDKSKVKTDQ